MTGPSGDGRVVVLQSFPTPRATTNPYISMLADNLRQHPDLDVRTFTWREALFGRPDVFHAHWPENLVSGPSVTKRLVKQILFGVALWRWRRHGTAVVRTRHNLDLPSGISRRERVLLTALERQTALNVRLNPWTEVPSGAPVETILHGHYRPWFQEYVVPAALPGRLSYVGLVRRYKGVMALVSAFREVDDPHVSLRVSGMPSTPEIAAHLKSEAAADPRIQLDLRFLPETDLVQAVGESRLVVLPYPEMHNSGTALLCLSLGRPILIPDNPINRGLQDEVGEGWVHLFTTPLSATDLTSCLGLAATAPATPPDLSRRDWTGVARDHARAYRRALSLVGRERRQTSASNGKGAS